MEQKYRAVKDYQINIDYKIDKLINIVKGYLAFKDKIINGFDDFDDFKKKTPSMGIRTTLENELKISKKEALNYLMGFPLNFKLKSFVEMLSYDELDYMKMNGSTNIEKIKYLISQKTKNINVGHVAELKFDFDKKKKLIKAKL